MSTVSEIEAALPQLSNDELRRLERAILLAYRKRDMGVIYDDSYGIWTEEDQLSAAARTFVLFDSAEESDSKGKKT